MSAYEGIAAVNCSQRGFPHKTVPFSPRNFHQSRCIRGESDTLLYLPVGGKDHNIEPSLEHVQELPFVDPMPVRAHVCSGKPRIEKSADRITQLRMEIKIHALSRRRGRTA